RLPSRSGAPWRSPLRARRGEGLDHHRDRDRRATASSSAQTHREACCPGRRSIGWNRRESVRRHLRRVLDRQPGRGEAGCERHGVDAAERTHQPPLRGDDPGHRGGDRQRHGGRRDDDGYQRPARPCVATRSAARRAAEVQPPDRATAVRRLCFLLLVLTAGCQSEAHRLLIVDLTLADPLTLEATAAPWHALGYRVEYRRLYPHLARQDLARYRTLVLLGGREPGGRSDALTLGDLAIRTEWIHRDGVVVLGYTDGDLDRWVMNQWLAAQGAGLEIGTAEGGHQTIDATPLPH